VIDTPDEAPDEECADDAGPDHLEEHRETARLAGLNYVTDGFAGIRRKGVGTGWAFYNPDGSRITDKRERQRLLALAIPPAWTDVWICPDPRGHIQVTARDARGRKQYRYHTTYREARDASKFRHMLEFSELLPGIRERVEQDLSAPNLSRAQVLATVVRLLDKTLIRVGNHEYARENNSFGLTTLRTRHVKVKGADLRFSFRGKSGVEHTVALTDRRLARIIQRVQDLPGYELFQYLDSEGHREAVTSGDVNEYLREITDADVTAKNFRTWAGTILAAQELRRLGPAATLKEAEKNVVAAVDVVAKRLGNTRAVCRKYYIHPTIISTYLAGLVTPPPSDAPAPRVAKEARPSGALRRDEIVVLQFLQDHAEDSD
jgi:DNA topoisomerase-1